MQPMPEEARGASASAAAEETLQAVAGLMLGDALRGDRLVVARPEMKAMEWELSFERWLEERCRKLDPSSAHVAACMPALHADSPSEVPRTAPEPLARSATVAPPALRASPALRAPPAPRAPPPSKAFSAAPLRFRVPLQEQTRLPQTQVGTLAPKAIAKQPVKASGKQNARAKPKLADTPHAAGHRAMKPPGATPCKARTGSPTIDFRAQKRTINNVGPKPTPTSNPTGNTTFNPTGLSAAAKRAPSHLPMRASHLSGNDAAAPRAHAPPPHFAAPSPRFGIPPSTAPRNAPATGMLPPAQWGLVPCTSAAWRPAAAAAWGAASLPTSPEA